MKEFKVQTKKIEQVGDRPSWRDYPTNGSSFAMLEDARGALRGLNNFADLHNMPHIPSRIVVREISSWEEVV
jgi:hypothetical protein